MWVTSQKSQKLIEIMIMGLFLINIWLLDAFPGHMESQVTVTGITF
jgi:hypothetical protein